MPVIITEILGFSAGTPRTEAGDRKRKFAIRGASTPEEAHAAFVDYVLVNYSTFIGLPWKKFTLTEEEDHGMECLFAEVEYGIDKNEEDKNEDEEGNEFALPTFNIRGGTRKVIRPIALTGRVVKTGFYSHPVDYKLIGWNKEEYTGTEIEAPDLTFMVPKLYTPAQINFSFVKKLAYLVSAVNEASFYGLAKGECTYLGPDMSHKTITQTDLEGNKTYVRMIELQHHFRCQPNLSQVKFGECPPIDIPGWDHVDIHYAKMPHDTGDGKYIMLDQPIQVDVWQVREYKNFKTELGL